jgi:hypothetical protein
MATAKARWVIMGVIADSFLTSKTCPLWPEWSAIVAGIEDHRRHRGQELAAARTRTRGRKRYRPTASVCATGMVITPVLVLARRLRRANRVSGISLRILYLKRGSLITREQRAY